jgi:hypothetical protein
MVGVRVRVTNGFHNTATTAFARQCGSQWILSATQARRIRNHLCGVGGCTCGGPLGERNGMPGQPRAIATPSGSSSYLAEQQGDGTVVIIRDAEVSL